MRIGIGSLQNNFKKLLTNPESSANIKFHCGDAADNFKKVEKSAWRKRTDVIEYQTLRRTSMKNFEKSSKKLLKSAWQIKNNMIEYQMLRRSNKPKQKAT